jgi:hypothetical protein
MRRLCGGHLTDHQVSRALGATEHYFWLSNQKQPKHFIIVAEILGLTSEAGWHAAFRQILKTHPLLRVGVAPAQGKVSIFVEHSEAEVPLQFFSDTGEGDWHNHVVEELLLPFGPNAVPLWRGRILHGADQCIVLLCLHHSISDGLSAVYLIRDLLKVLSGEHLNPYPLPMSQERLLSRVDLTRLTAPPFDSSTLWPPAVNQDWNAGTLSVHSLRLPRELTERLRLVSRHEGATIQGALVAALTQAGARNAEPWRQLPVRVVSPVNNRPLLGLSDESVLSIVFPAGIYRPSDAAGQFWQTARQVRADLSPIRTENGLQAVYEAIEGLMGAMPQPNDIAEFERTVGACEMMVSNLGAIPISNKFGELTLRALWGPSVLVGIEGEQMIGVATVNDQICLLQTSFKPITQLLEDAASILEFQSHQRP